MPRNVDDIEQAMRNVMANRAAKAAHRDRREHDMLAAVRDVERYETQMAGDDAILDGLLDELGQALDARTLADMESA